MRLALARTGHGVDVFSVHDQPEPLAASCALLGRSRVHLAGVLRARRAQRRRHGGADHGSTDHGGTDHYGERDRVVQPERFVDGGRRRIRERSARVHRGELRLPRWLRVLTARPLRTTVLRAHPRGWLHRRRSMPRRLHMHVGLAPHRDRRVRAHRRQQLEREQQRVEWVERHRLRPTPAPRRRTAPSRPRSGGRRRHRRPCRSRDRSRRGW